VVFHLLSCTVRLYLDSHMKAAYICLVSISSEDGSKLLVSHLSP
jgi:hypothetical protein